MLRDGAWPRAIWVCKTQMWMLGLKSCTGVLAPEVALVQGTMRLP